LRRSDEQAHRRLMKLCLAGDRMFNEASAQLEAKPGDTPSVEELNHESRVLGAALKDEDNRRTFGERVQATRRRT
jgi:hypothetical protein